MNRILQLLIMEIQCWWNNFDTPLLWDMESDWDSNLNAKKAVVDVMHLHFHVAGYQEDYVKEKAGSLRTVTQIEEIRLWARTEEHKTTLQTMSYVSSQANDG